MVEAFHSSFCWSNLCRVSYCASLADTLCWIGLRFRVGGSSGGGLFVTSMRASNTRCKRAFGNGIQRCNSNCQIDVAENKKKALCK